MAARTLLLAVLLGAAAAPAVAAGPERFLYLQPLGVALPDEEVALVTFALREFYGLAIKVLPRVELPAAAWYAPRRRWRAEKLLDFLALRLPADGDRILGLTAADISTTKGKVHDWGVLGLGGLGGPSGVISSFRCQKRSRGAEHARQRLAKVAVHEIGHTRGLDHCPNRGCLMQDAEGQVVTSDGEYDLCARCRAGVAAAGRPLPATPKIPWPRP